MSSNLKVNNILPSTGANIGLGTASGTLNVDGGCKVQVGTALTLGHTQGVQFHTQNLHSTGFEINQINASGIVTSSTQINVGSNIKLGSAGVATATSFVGSGANLTSLPAGQLTGTIADARISASSVQQYATSFNDNNIINDISALALKINALQNATRYNTNSTYVETFQDSNGIASLTNTQRNTNEYVSSMVSVAKSYYKPSTDYWTFTQSSTGTGGNSPMTFVAWMKSANGSNWTYNGSQGGGILNMRTTNGSFYVCYNIGYGSNNGKFGSHTPGRSDCNTSSAWSAPTNKWVMGVVRTYSNWTSGQTEIMHRAYDASSWTTDGDSNGGSDNAGVLGSGQGRLFRHASNSYTGDYDNTYVAHIGYWNARLDDTQLNGLWNNGKTFDWTTSNSGYTATSNLQEYFKLNEGSGTTFANAGNGGNATRQSGSGSWDTDSSQIPVDSLNATGNFISNAITASSSTNKMGVVITYIDTSGTATLNTDLKVYLSANNGSNFTQVTLVAQPNFATGVKMALVNDVTVTAGTQLKYKVEFANQASGSKETRVTGVSLQY